jgi:hypothetical protein
MLPRTANPRAAPVSEDVEMSTSGSTREPDDSGLLRRGLFARREPAATEPMMTATEYRVADSLQRAIDDRLEDGLRVIEEQATALMREVATEIWRSSSKDVRPEQERIVTLLSRDQAIRSLIASSDERFQALAVRSARLEDHLGDLAETGRATREAMEASATAIREIASSPTLHGVESVRTQLEMVERHIAEAFAHFDDRDEQIADAVLTQVREHGELIARETARIVESMQSYVQGGAEAVGRLAQRVEEHAQSFVAQDHDIEASVRGIVDEQTAELTQQMEMLGEKVGLHGRDQDTLRAALERMLDARIRGLAELVRSDSQALQRLLEERMARGIAGPIAASGIEGDAGEIVDAVSERMAAIGRVVDERIGALERTMQEQVLLLSSATSASVERTLERMTNAAGSLDGVDVALLESQTAIEERMMQHIDDRMTAIARLIRSDNQILADKLAAAGPTAIEPIDGDVMKQLVRSFKELQAGVSSDVMSTVETRFQAVSDQMHKETQLQAEAMLKIAEILGQKIDRLSVRMDEGMGNDLQIVVDRMSDAIQAMSTVRRDIA